MGAFSQQSQGRVGASAPAGRRRLSYLDGVRGYASLYVVVSHAWASVWVLPAERASPLRADTFWLGAGRYAVTVFIIVSGFSLGLTFWRKGGQWPGGPRDFLVRRARRLVPPYWAAIAFGASIAALVLVSPSGTLFDQAIPNRWTGIVSHALALQDLWWGGPAGSTTFWSLAVELHIYLAFAGALVLTRRWVPPWMLVYLALCIAAVVGQVGPRTWLVVKLDDLYPSLYAMFLLGLAASRFAVRDDDWARRETRRWHRQLLVCGVAGITAFVVSLRSFSFNSPVADLVIGPIAAFLIAIMATGHLPRLIRLLSTRVAVWLGHCSYSLYLVHSVILELVWRTLVRPLGMPQPAQLAAQVIVGALLSVVVARVFYRLVERPFMSRRSRPPSSALSRRWLRGEARPVPDAA